MTVLHDLLVNKKIILPDGNQIDLFGHVSLIKQSAQSWLKGLEKNGIKHSERLEEYLDALTKNLRKNNQLSPDEIFILLCAVYLHDIGYWSAGQIISKGHPSRSKEMILQNPKKYHFDVFPPFAGGFPLIAKAVSIVCEGHSSDILLSSITNAFEDAILNQPDLRKLSALLRLADEIDDAYIRPGNASDMPSYRAKIPSVRIGEEIICWCCDEYPVREISKIHKFFLRKQSVLDSSLQYLRDIKAGNWFICPCSPEKYFYSDSINIVSKLPHIKQESPGLLEIMVKSSLLSQPDKNQEAIKYYLQTLEKSQISGDNDMEGWALIFLGLLYFQSGNYEKSIGHFNQAIILFNQIGDNNGLVYSFGNLGNLYTHIREYNQAKVYYNRVLEISHITKNVHAEGNAYGNLGIIYSTTGDSKEAISFYIDALEKHSEIQDYNSLFYDFVNLGDLIFTLNDYENAIEIYKNALKLPEQLTDIDHSWAILTKIGMSYKKLGQFDEAIEYYNRALTIARNSNDIFKEGDNLNRLGVAYKNTGDFKGSIDALNSALEIHQKIMNFRYIASDLSNLGATYVEMGISPTATMKEEMLKKAINILERSIDLDSELGYLKEKAQDLFNVGIAYFHINKKEKGNLVFSQAKKIFFDLELPEKVFQVESQERYYNLFNR